MTWRTASRQVPAFVAGACLALSATLLIIIGGTNTPWADVVDDYVLGASAMSLTVGLTGALIMREKPGNRLGPLFAAAGLWGLAGVVAGLLLATVPAGNGHNWLAWLSGMWTVPLIILLWTPLLYAEGRVFSPTWRPVWLVSAGAGGISAVALALAPGMTDEGITNPIAAPLPDSVLLGTAGLGLLVCALAGVAGLVGQVVRARRVSGTERARVAWLIAAVALVLTGVAVPWPTASTALDCAAAIVLGVGILRAGLFDIQAVLTRSFAYVVVVGVAMSAALTVAWFAGDTSAIGVFPALAATVVALLLAGTFSAITGFANRLLFGQRTDPLSALTELGDRLATAGDPLTLPEVVVTTVSSSMRLPYCALTLPGDGAPAAEIGQRPDHVTTVELAFAGESVGVLAAGARRGETGFSAADTRLLRGFADQASAAAHAVATVRELQRSRERIVGALEEERRALRRELHDGVGPTLAGLKLGLESLARRQSDPGSAELADELAGQAAQALESVRRVSRDLRPAVLDDLGLAEAVRQHAHSVQRLIGDTPTIHVEVHPLPQLPAAVEVAAYRIVTEGLSNALRHADAQHATVAITAGTHLLVRVEDDGNGDGPVRTGVGLVSMPERAAELGGRCDVEFRPGRGTTVTATLPLVVGV